MNWFNGSIAEAVTQAKKVANVFIVFVYDESELSLNGIHLLEDDEIVKKLTKGTIAIKLKNGSTEAIQFAEIYPLITIPSLYFINPKNGTPLEVLADFQKDQFCEKMKNILVNHEQNKSEKHSKIFAKSDESSSSSSIMEEKSNNSEEVPEAASISSSTKEQLNADLGDDPEPALCIDRRVEKAKELIDQINENKRKEQLEKEKEEEIERRHQMKELSKAKEKKSEFDRNEIKNERIREKMEDKMARERIKAQIAADREERLRRERMLRGEDNEQPNELSPSGGSSTTAKSTVNKENVTRIKFKFPDNSSELTDIESSSPLADVRTYVANLLSNKKKNLNLQNFRMMGTVPSRIFTEDDMDKSLIELGLAPSSILIIRPMAKSSLSPSSTGGFDFLTSVFWNLLAPLTLIFNYISNFFTASSGGRAGRQNSSPRGYGQSRTTGGNSQNNAESSSSSRVVRPKTAYGSRTGDSTIHRLRRDEDSDEENNTWNGNSTQQQ